MNWLLLGVAIAAALLLSMVARLRWPGIGMPLLVASVLRFPVGLIGFHAVPIRLPYSGHDAVGFEQAAWRIASAGWPAVLDALNPLTGFHMVAPFSVIYALVGREPYALVGYNVILGVMTVAVVYGIGYQVAEHRAARWCAWAMAVFPAAILMSSLVLRESGVGFGVALGILGVAGAMRHRTAPWVLLSTAGFALASLLHGGMLIPAIALLTFLSVSEFRNSAKGSRVRLRSTLVAASVITLVAAAVWISTTNQVSFASFGTLDMETAESQILSENPRVGLGGSAYYGDVTTESWAEAASQLPVRLGLFMFSPMPWTVSSYTQLIGLLDGFFWLFMCIVLVRTRKRWWGDPVLRALFVFGVAAIIVFALGTTNAGTALRHRTKIIPAILPLLMVTLLSGRRDREAWQTGQAREQHRGHILNHEAHL